uniref:Uncharacterized protein n=1 Tax=Panagrolaimus sp. ES5 TaxID=591445 RepID=A0AC34F545_9BILA
MAKATEEMNMNNPPSKAARPPSTPPPPASSGHNERWAKTPEEEDRVEKLIRDSGCWDQHLRTVECMSDKEDWRKCQDEMSLEEDGDTVCNMFGQFDIASSEDATSSDTSQSSIEDSAKVPVFDDTKPGQLFLLGDWYLKPDALTKPIWDELEILHKQAMYLAWRCRHREAFKIYKKIYNSYDHKGSHRREILDAMVHSSLRGKHAEPLEASYYALKNDVETFGDQLNLWSTTITIAETRGGYLVSPIEHISAIIYLSVLAECGRHWNFFDKIDTTFLPKKCNFRFGAKVRAFFLLKQEYGNFERSADSIEKVTEDLMIKLRKEMLQSHTEEEIINSRNHMCSDIVKTPKTLNSIEEPPPHACKLDSIVKSHEELDIIRNHFVSKFSFLFEDNHELATKLCEASAPAAPTIAYEWKNESDEEGEKEKLEETLLHSRTFPNRSSPPLKHRSNRSGGFI